MFLLCIIITNVLVVAAEVNLNEGYCDINTKSCQNEHSQKLIFYDVNAPEGFNLRRDVYMRFAVMLKEAEDHGKTDWKLVLPPWYNLYHWKTEKRRPTQWSKYFDINSLKSYAPVIEMHEVFTLLNNNRLEIDILYVLQNFEDAFENGIFTEKWSVVGECKHKHFWGYTNITAKEILCVKFQGKTSKLWELISLHPNAKKVMFAHGEIPLHDNYGTKSYWNCRKSMKFNKELVKIAKTYISQVLECKTKKCINYLSVHWRRQDFARSRGNDVPTIAGTAKQINKIMQKNNFDNIFIATDASMAELSSLEKELSDHNYKVHFFLPSEAIIDEFGDGGVAIIDQIICSRAAYFIGTHESTFTYRIQEEREILGFDSSTTFNRLCPDTGRCENMSEWTIVH